MIIDARSVLAIFVGAAMRKPLMFRNVGIHLLSGVFQMAGASRRIQIKSPECHLLRMAELLGERNNDTLGPSDVS
jgi:hypothetical protein